MFSFPLKEGVATTALKDKYSVVLSEKTAAELFGKEPAVGKTIMADDSIPLTVTGVLATIPANSSIKTDVLLSVELLKDNKDFMESADWYNTFAQSYLLLRKGADPKALDQKTARLVQQFSQGDGKKNVVKAVSFASKRDEADATIKTIVTSAIGASVFILLIIIVNLLNLNAATMFSRTKEVAVRQMIGSGKLNIIIQFCIENALVVLFSLGLGFLFFINFLLPQVNKIISSQFGELQFLWHHDYTMLLLFIGIALLVVLVAGSYPALHLTSVKITEAVKGNIVTKKEKGFVRNVFIGLQFLLAVTLICIAIVFSAQIRYMKSAALGFDKDNVIVANLDMEFKDPKAAESEFEGILNSLKANPYVKSFSTTREIPMAYRQNYNDFVDVETGKKVHLRQTRTDSGFIETFGIPIVAGHNFSNELAGSEEKSIMLNQVAVKAFGWTNPVGKQIKSAGGGNDIYTVAGVMKDFHYEDLQQPIGPLLHGFSGKPDLNNKYLSIRADGAHSKEILVQLENAFKNIPGRRPFTYHFMSDLVDDQYALLTGILKITNYVALLTVIIACMGMFGLMAVFAGRRVKEIGIRKVLGASVLSITSLLSKEFLMIVVVAIIAAVPVTGWIMHRWLQDFAYRINMQWWMFAAGGMIALLVALLTVSVQSIKAATANPVKSLRTE